MEGLWCHVIQSQKRPMTCKIRNTNQHIPACNPKSAGWMYIGFLVSTQRWAASQQSSVLCFAATIYQGGVILFFGSFFFSLASAACGFLASVASWLRWLLGFLASVAFGFLASVAFGFLASVAFGFLASVASWLLWLLGFCGFLQCWLRQQLLGQQFLQTNG